MSLIKGCIAIQYRITCGSKKCNNKDDFYSINESEAQLRALREGWSEHWEDGWICPSCTEERRYEDS